ncbi:MAG TPA: monovalent cation/H(+) antiporter subunit G [Nitrospiria bacterium]|nr:monovalent cation/H(+) antiporter subunit G [Nitrospiria bacterium]
MEALLITLVILFIFSGLFFLFVAALGMIRLPDVFSRAHAISVTDTFGVVLVLAGLALYQGFTPAAVKTILILVLLFHLNPVIAHATLRAALRSGHKPGETGPSGKKEGEKP